MCSCKQLAIKNFNHIINEIEKENYISPENKIYWKTRYQIIHYYIEIGQSEQICQSQENRLKKCLDDYMEWNCLIYAYYYAGKYKEAYECFIKANSKFSDKWEIYDIASYVCRALKRFDDAIKYSDISYKLNSEYLDAVYSKAFCFEEMGDYKSAYHTWLFIIDSLKKDGYHVEVKREEERAQACLKKIKQQRRKQGLVPCLHFVPIVPQPYHIWLANSSYANQCEALYIIRRRRNVITTKL